MQKFVVYLYDYICVIIKYTNTSVVNTLANLRKYKGGNWNGDLNEHQH